MIKELPESEGSVLGVEITSKVSLEEEKEWIERFEKVIKKRGKISALVVLGEQASAPYRKLRIHFWQYEI